jgi:sarcinarray family protein
MKKILILLFAIGIISFIHIAGAISTENEYGNVKAWLNGQEATVKGVKLKIGEPADIRVTVTSNISGNIYVKLTNPLVTEPYDVIEGTSIGKRIDNIGVSPGWSKTFSWKIKPNGAWTNGNAPINIFVEFSKIKNDKKIEFTIADPFILNEQFNGAISTAKSTHSPTENASPTPVKAVPFTPFLFAVGALLLAWRWR